MNNKTIATAIGTTVTATGADSTLNPSKLGKCNIVGCNVIISFSY